MDELVCFERYLHGEAAYSKATCSAYLADCAALRELAQGKALAQISPADIRRFVRQYKQQGQNGRSIARRLSAWRAWYAFLQREGMLVQNPAHAIKAPKAAKKLPNAISVDGVAGLLEAINDDEPLSLRDRAMFELAYSGGLRVSELVGCNLGDLQAAMLRVLGKGGKQRDVPVGSKAMAAVGAWLAARALLAKAGEPALFVSRFGTRMSSRAVQLRLDSWSQRLGLADPLHPHRLRHACASHFLQGSQDLRATQELLGHASIKSTQIYTSLDFQHLAAVYDQAHPRAKDRT